MAIPADKLRAAVMADPDCGPSLELEGDRDYFNFLARVEGLLPASYFEFDRSTVDFDKEIQTVSGLLARSVDLGLLTLLCKLVVLSGDFDGFVDSVSTLALVVRERWKTVHPRVEDFGVEARWSALQGLDDRPHVILPLHAAKLLASRRIGALTLRGYLLSERKIEPRRNDDGEELEKAPTSGDVLATFKESPPDALDAARAKAAALVDAVAEIENACDELGVSGALRLPGLREAALTIRALLSGEGGAAPAAPGVSRTVDTGSAEPAGEGSGSVEEARADISAALGYFETREPSSPARLLLAQARALIGKSLFDVLTTLVPDTAAAAAIRLPNADNISLPVERLAGLLEGGDAETFADAMESESAESAEAEGLNLEDPFVTEGDSSDAGEAGPSGEAGDEGGDETPAEEEEPSAEVAESSESESAAVPAPPAAPRRRAAASRAEAIEAMNRASAFFSAQEPSSPIPLLLERARLSVGRDFLALLREVLPPSE